MNRKSIVTAIIFMVCMILFVACSSDDTSGKAQEENNNMNEQKDTNENNEQADVAIPDEPVTVTLWNWMGEEAFEENFKNPVEEKFDHITFEIVSGGPDKTTIEELLAKGERPDIIWGGAPWQIQLYEEFELTSDMSSLIEQFDYTYDHLDPGGILDVSNYFREDEFNALPFLVPRMVLHYNKEIFDLFGVDYPENDMTWDEVIDLATKVTGERNGVEYSGIGLNANDFLALMLGEPILDPETHEPILSKSDKWRRGLEAIERIYNIPGNLPEGMDPESFFHGGYFGGEKRLAMSPTWFSGYLVNDEGLDWDVVTYPVWDDQPNQAPLTGSQWMGVASTSENPTEAFRVLTYLLSEEHLTEQYAGAANIPEIPLGNFDVIQEIEPHPELEDVDYMSSFNHDLTVGREELSKYEGVLGRLQDYQIPKEIIFDNQDLNTAIRKIEEWTVQQVEDAMSEE